MEDHQDSATWKDLLVGTQPDRVEDPLRNELGSDENNGPEGLAETNQPSATPGKRSHVPVLLAEVIELLAPKPGERFIDATLGRGGHAKELADRLGPTGHLLGIDQDPAALDWCRAQTWPTQMTYWHGNFSQIGAVQRKLNWPAVDGLLADLGVSSPQLDQAERGFSFRQEGPLDMRMDTTGGMTAAELVAQADEKTLARIFWEYGEERHSRRIARAIVDARKSTTIATSTQLAELVRQHMPRSRERGIDPATRVFQALRIAVNDELASLDLLLHQLPDVVAPGGRVAIISFHSLEDRRVKQAFRQQDIWQMLTRKPVTASPAEEATNPRSRSAKLRVAKRLGG